MNHELREELAALEHDQWARWMTHLFKQSSENDDSSITIPVWAVERWKRQAAASYADLSESEKDSDRAEADRVLRILKID